jgi:hypothetical protein
MRLRSVLFTAKNRLAQPHVDGRSQSITNYVHRYRKGSKATRQIIEHRSNSLINVRELRHVNTFFGLVNLPVPDSATLRRINKSWCLSYLPSRVKDFIFKMRSNYLQLNNRLNAYNENVDPKCTFCRIPIGGGAARDSLEHCFLTCPTSGNAINALNREFFNNYQSVTFLIFFGQVSLKGRRSFFNFLGCVPVLVI